jgi:hypothetical protein
VQAALAYGLKGEVILSTASQGADISVTLEPTKAVMSPLCAAITDRQCTRAIFDGTPISVPELNLLGIAGTGSGVKVILITERSAMENILEYVVQGNATQMNDPKFIAELKRWVRFSGDEAVTTGDGLYAGASGNPAVPRWLGSPMFDFLFTAKNENDKYASQVRSSAGIAVFVSEVNDEKHWIEVGRCYERFALQATALGIRNAFLNQPVEVLALRERFGSLIGVKGGRVDLVVRFGRSAKMPQSLRRPLAGVLMQEA